MKKLRYNSIIQAEGIIMKLIDKSDAKFIVDLRTDRKLGKFISNTSLNIDDQINWIKEYKKREANQKEFYFIFEDSNHKLWGAVRLYNLSEDSFTLGSWICLPGNNDNIAIKAWLLGIVFGFEKLNYKTCLLDVRKKNLSVLNYIKLYFPILIKEDVLNYFFRLDKDIFYKNRERVIKLLNLKL